MVVDGGASIGGGYSPRSFKRHAATKSAGTDTENATIEDRRGGQRERETSVRQVIERFSFTTAICPDFTAFAATAARIIRPSEYIAAQLPIRHATGEGPVCP